MVKPESRIVHAVAIALSVDHDGPLFGVLMTGPPGAGKTALALSSIETCPWRRTALVADDQVLIDASVGSLVAAAPDALAGKMELRGLAIVGARKTASIALGLSIDFAAPVERMPLLTQCTLVQGAPPVLTAPAPRSGDVCLDAVRLRAFARSFLAGQIASLAHDATTQS